MFEKVLKNELLGRAAEQIRAGRTAAISGVWGSSAAMLAAAIGRLAGRPALFVTAHLDAADDAADDIEVFTGRAPLVFPAWDTDVFAADHVNDEIAGERMRICNLLGKRGAAEGRGRDDHAPQDSPEAPAAEVIVAPIMALLQPVPSEGALARGRLSLTRGQDLGIDQLASWLVDAGFEHVDQVDQQGDFARRGGIADVFPPGVAQAVRVEFFGDEIASIRLFDLDTQRSTDEISGYDLTAVATGRETDPARTTTLFTYLPAETIICTVEPEAIKELAEEICRRAAEGISAADEAVGLREPEELFSSAGRFASVEMYAFRPKAGGKTFDMGIRSLESLSVNAQEAIGQLGELSADAEVWVYCENPAEEKRFRELLSSAATQMNERIHTGIGHVAGGFRWPAERLIVVGHHEVFHRYAKRRRIRRVRAGRPIESLLDLQMGDYVVHVGHGIARFEGLRQLDRDGRTEEFLTLRFAGNAVLHVPASRINLVQKYIAPRKMRPSLSRLGGATWGRQKERVATAVHDLAAEMLRIQAVREAMPGVSYPPRTSWLDQFASEFIYTETEDQLASMEQIGRDMAAARPMDRLLCGDVGYGKTELAMRAAFKTAEAGRQTAVLVPTTVLAAQHYRTFKERLADYPMIVEVISRFRKPAEQAKIVKRVAAGQVDILIGTHRLLSDDIRFADLGLVIIDEEQRFGVDHKERLKRMRATVDVLTLTATPIPRTLHMALLGLRDISSLATPPLDRRAIHTEVVGYNDGLIRHAVLRELNRQGQVFFVHNRVFNIDKVADRVRKLAPEARVEIAHGQMPSSRLERTMLRFVRQDIDVLVCTTIIESGLDIPTANTMIIHEADRFGLADLHQLRGRVGRYKHLAHCYLLLPESRPVSRVAAKRLKAIEEFSDLGAGFQIAMRDLEIRGAGNILGREQSGHIVAVGYEMYCQLLERAVGKLRGEAPAPVLDVHVELGIDAYIPRSYVPADRQRMEIYRRMSACSDTQQLDQLRADLCDAYGLVPLAVDTLLELARIRVLAGRVGIKSIMRMDPDIIFQVTDFGAARKVLEGAAGTVRLPDAKTAHWRPPAAYYEQPTLLRVLLKRLREACGRV
ncbi:MAG: transcription-repair coupling factor [Planctomycetota bacterium]|jgi:transcription-repair coupling factor (superfamily II helicase)